LFDTGATHSFITTSLAKRIGLPIVTTTSSFRVKILTGSVVTTREMLKDCPMEIQGHLTTSDLVVLEMNKYEVILGMSWLTLTRAVVDCRKKIVSFKDQSRKEVEFVGETAMDGRMKLNSFEVIMDEEIVTESKIHLSNVEKEGDSL